MRILVCGGREFNDSELLWSELDKIVQSVGTLSTIISGMARGADTLAVDYALANSLPIRKYPADWDRHGKAAGFIRNQQMLDEGNPDLVVAFPGGRGTADMVRRARKAGVEVRVVE
jgi:hypothetical protein